jgi:hypothetical protein
MPVTLCGPEGCALRSDRPKQPTMSLRASVVYDRRAQDGTRGYLHSSLSEYSTERLPVDS